MKTPLPPAPRRCSNCKAGSCWRSILERSWQKDANVPLGPPRTGEFSIGHTVAGKAAVDALLAQAERAGATLTDQPHDRPWGIYSGYFRDLDGHLWEVIWNPQLGIEN